MAHKKGQGSSRNGRDSKPKYRGIKMFGGQKIRAGSIIVRQKGTKYFPMGLTSVDGYVNNRGKVYFCPMVYIKTGISIGFDDFFGYMQLCPTQLKSESEKTRNNRKLSYKERIGQCGDSVNIFEINNFIDVETGEIKTVRNWKGNMNVPAKVVLENLFDPGNPKRKRRSLLAQNLQQAKYIIENAANSGN